jgi:hypothetical protein
MANDISLDARKNFLSERRRFLQAAGGAALAWGAGPLAAIGNTLVGIGVDTALAAPAARYLFDPQQRREIQTRAKWAAIEGRPNVSAPGASCGPINNLLGGRQIVVPRGQFGKCPWTDWEECYAIPGSNLYMRLAWECHDLQSWPCPVRPKSTNSIQHFNITIAVQGNFPDNFNYYNQNGRQIVSDQHIAIWKQSTTGNTCVAWWDTWFDATGKHDSCLWSSCDPTRPSPFAPWSVSEAIDYYRARLGYLSRLLVSLAPSLDELILLGLILLIGMIVVLAIVMFSAAGAAGGAAALAILAF